MTKPSTIAFQFIPLTFVRRHEEIQNIIRNTIIMKSVYQRFHEIKSLGELLSNTQYGYTASAKETGNCRFLRITDLKETGLIWGDVPYCDCDAIEKYILKKNDILIARTGGTTGKSFLVDSVPETAVFASYLIRLSVSESDNPLYVYIFLNSFVFWSQIIQMKGGSAQPNVNAQKMTTIKIPYCPSEIQDAIVATFINGKTSTDSYIREIYESISKTLHKQESVKEIHSQTSVQKTFLEKLRQAILQEAVQGKLTEAWRQAHPDVEPASELLKRIQAEKTQLIKEKKIKKQKPLPPIKDEEIPFDLPEGWVWCRLGDISSKIGSGSTPRGGKSVYIDTGIKFFRSQNIHNAGLNLDDIAFIPETTHQKMQNTQVLPLDILLNITGGSIGRASLIPEDFDKGNVSQHVCIIRPIILRSSYLHYLILSPYFQNLIPNSVTGAGREGLPKNRLELFVVPLPPEKEQKVIVAKVERLLSYSDQLEQQIAKSHTTAEQLMQAVLREVFTTSA